MNEKPKLDRLAKSAIHREGLAALPVARYQLRCHLDDDALAAQLGCSLKHLAQLRLCQVPRPDHFEEDVAQIAAYAHVDAACLTQIFAPSTDRSR